MTLTKLKNSSNKQGTKVRIPWKKGDTISDWNETCIWAMEQFGLPGTNFSTHPNEDYMDFYFLDRKSTRLNSSHT